MRRAFLLFLIFLSLRGWSFVPSNHLPQSTPFEGILTALRSENAELLKSVFDRKTRKTDADINIWQKRLESGKKHFYYRFGEYNLDEFTYEVHNFGRSLVIFYLDVEVFKKRVVKERGEYKIIYRNG